MIDSHTHRYPPEVYSNPRKFAEKQGESHWLELVDPSQGSKLQGWASRQRMITDMDAASISQAVLLGWYWENPNTCFEHNNWHAQWIKEDPERFYAFASIHPAMPEPIEELKRRLDQGFVGIGECHPGVQGFTIKNPSWIKCVEFACENGWPINFHVTEPVGHDYPGRTATPFEDFHWLAREYPTLKIILSHAGGLFPFYELNPRIQKELNNVYYDLAACPLLYDSSLYRKLIDVVGYHKILWGTDYPLRIYPNIQSTPDFSTFRNEILSVAKLNKNEEEAIFHQNILSLLPC